MQAVHTTQVSLASFRAYLHGQCTERQYATMPTGYASMEVHVTKSILSSRTFWLALLLALGGAAVELVSALTDAGVTVPGWALALVGVVQVWLRTQTRDGVYLRQGRDEWPAPEVKP